MRDSLYIYPQDHSELPYDFHFHHNLAVHLHDDLVWILKNDEIQKRAETKIEFKNSKIPFNEKQVNDYEYILDWLKKNKNYTEIDKIISTDLLFAIISDICHFIYQSLDSAKNYKLSVAFSLIRKPFLENLLILEQLLVNENDFLRRYESSPKKIDPGKLSDFQKKDLIINSIEKISNNYLLNSELIYQLRWNKNSSNSIYANANLATHLVTTRNPSYKTEKQSMNFLFSDFETWDSHLSYFYYYIPILLYYTTELVDQYLLEKKILKLKKFKERKFLRLFGQILLHDMSDEKSSKGKSLANKVTKGLKVKCKSCNRINPLFKSDIFYMISEKYILCKFCLRDLLYETDSMRQMMSTIIKR